MLISYANNSFPDDYVPTVFDNYGATSLIRGKHVSLGLWDTAGQEDYDRLRPLSYPETNVFLICFSVVDRTSFENVLYKWIPEINEFSPEVPKILVGTKTDLREDLIRDRIEIRREKPVTLQEAEKLAKENNFYAYCETSARMLLGLGKLFETAYDAVMSPAPKKSSKGIGGFFSFLQKKEKEKITAPLPPRMPPAGKAPSIDIAPTTFPDDIKKLLQNDVPGSDMKVILEDGKYEVDCHKIIFSIASEYFERVLKDGTENEEDLIVYTPKTSTMKFRNVVKYDRHFKYIKEFIYCGHFSIEKDSEELKQGNLFGELEEFSISLGLEKFKDILTNLKEEHKSVEDHEFFRALSLSVQSYIMDERADKLKKIFDNSVDDEENSYSDICIGIGKKQYHLHKSLLSARSEYLSTLVNSDRFFDQNNETESGKNLINIELGTDSADDLRIFLEFLYTSHTYENISYNNALPLLAVSNKFQQRRLVSFCELRSSKVIDKEVAEKIERSSINVIGVLIFADFHNANLLTNFCLHLVASNYHCFKRKQEWKLVQKNETMKKYVEENQWPPKKYLEEVNEYEKKLKKYWKKIGKKNIKKDFSFSYIGKNEDNERLEKILREEGSKTVKIKRKSFFEKSKKDIEIEIIEEKEVDETDFISPPSLERSNEDEMKRKILENTKKKFKGKVEPEEETKIGEEIVVKVGEKIVSPSNAKKRFNLSFLIPKFSFSNKKDRDEDVTLFTKKELE